MNGGIDSPVSRSFQRRHLHVAAVISFPTWKSSLLLVCFLPSCVILRGKVCLTNLGASYLTAATTTRRKQILARNFVATSIELRKASKLPSFIYICFFYFFKYRTYSTFYIANIRISIFRIFYRWNLFFVFFYRYLLITYLFIITIFGFFFWTTT